MIRPLCGGRCRREHVAAGAIRHPLTLSMKETADDMGNP